MELDFNMPPVHREDPMFYFGAFLVSFSIWFLGIL